ncbi:DUF3099 domain-containing protein [Georgenia sp. 10Sc9-8]|uniref:DUF3099 domain-containing protein n=1 Tax=Georgenia halotolerans TaxID=3028317 RepID=A0ABT5TZ92_9MICO|nr:DUF3099 domain-containing protein [Georgenia halotolerans]
MGTRWRRRAAREPEVQSITSARRALGEDVHDRTVRYLISMGVRTLCLILAAFTPPPWRWLFVAAAVLLPYVAVVLANAGRERVEQPQTALGLPVLEAQSAPTRRPTYDPETEYLR